MTYRYRYIDSPIGELMLAGDETGLKRIEFPDGKLRFGPQEGWRESKSGFADAARQLKEYFAGKRKVFDLELSPEGTEFQRQTWEALCDIPYGATASYGDIARAIGRPKAVRAVGAANGKNPLPIVVPCHRVIGSDGSMTGFGGGIPVKEKLLRLEGALIG